MEHLLGQTSPVVSADEETTIIVRVNSATLHATSVVELATSHLLVALKQLGSPLEAPQGKPNGCPLLLSLPHCWKYPQHSLMTLQNQLMRLEESLFVVRDTPASPPYRVELHVNDQPLTIEVNMGCCVTGL